jgi:hypothetical protein
MPPYSAAAVRDPQWLQGLSRHPAFRDLLTWLVLRRDQEVRRLISNDGGGIDISRGKILELEAVYRILNSEANRRTDAD